MKTNKVSVVMSCLNTPKDYLDTAIKSILNQTYNNIEFVIVNNGGNNYKDLLEYQKLDDRIVIINNNITMDLPSALNKAIQNSTGDFIARMDSDDFSLPDRIEKQVHFLNDNPNVCLCSMYAKLFGTESSFMIYPLNKPEEVKSSLFLSNELFHPTVMFRADFARNNMLLYDKDYNYSEDFELWNRFADLGDVAILPRLGLLYRVHSGSTSNQKSNIQRNSKQKVVIRNLEKTTLKQEDKQYLMAMSDNTLIGSIDDNINVIRLLCDDKVIEECYDVKCLKQFLMIKLISIILKNNKSDIVYLIRWKIIGESRFLVYLAKKFFKTIICRLKYITMQRKLTQ